MTSVINVSKPEIDELDFTYDTIEAAIAQDTNVERRRTCERSAKVIRGSKIVGFQRADNEIVFSLDFGKTLTIRGSKTGPVFWEIGESGTTCSAAGLDELGDRVEVHHSGGESAESFAYMWDRVSPLQKRIDSEVTGLFAGHAAFLLYTKGDPILMFTSLIDSDREVSILHWGDAE